MFWDSCSFTDIRRIEGAGKLPWLDWRDAPERVEWAPISFYRDEDRDHMEALAAEAQGWDGEEIYRLVRVVPRLNSEERSRYDMAAVFYLIDADGDVLHLDGTARPIHEANDMSGLQLDQRSCFDYLDFFCSFVTSDRAPFTLPRNAQDFRMPAFGAQMAEDDDADAKVAREVLESFYRSSFCRACPPRKIRQATRMEDDRMAVTAVVAHKGHAHSARFAITESGSVEMLDDEHLTPDHMGLVGLHIETFVPEMTNSRGLAFGRLRMN